MSDYEKKTLPYTTSTGVRIGLYYSPPPEYVADLDAQAIQFALINKLPKPTLLERIFSARWSV